MYNNQDIQNWTEKVIKYEQNPGNGDLSYLTRCFFTQADQMQQGNQAGLVGGYLPAGFGNPTI